MHLLAGPARGAGHATRPLLPALREERAPFETEWLAGRESQRLLECAIGKLSDRPLQWFACACCRRVGSALGTAS